MPLSWNEIRDRALTFSREWAVKNLFAGDIIHSRGSLQ